LRKAESRAVDLPGPNVEDIFGIFQKLTKNPKYFDQKKFLFFTFISRLECFAQGRLEERKGTLPMTS
jgi:hypothetical protein